MSLEPRLNKPELPPIGFLETLSEDDLRLLSSYGQFTPAEKGTEIIVEGEPQEQLYLIISGILHVVREQNNTRTLLWRASPGETLGEVNLFDPGTASATVVAQEYAQIWSITRGDLEDFVNAYPEAGAQLMLGISRLLSKRLRAMNERFKMLQKAMADNAGWR